MRGRSKLPSLLSSPLGRDWERGHLPPHGWRARNVCAGRFKVNNIFVVAS